MVRVCEFCGVEFEAQSSKGRFCKPAHRLAAHRGKSAPAKPAKKPSKSAKPKPLKVLVTAAEADESRAGVLAATILALEAAGRLQTPIGQAALQLANRLDHSSGDSGAAVAALAKQLQASLAEALANAEQVADPVDELRRKRELRLASG